MDKSQKLRKKILFINGHLNVGGCERSLVNLLKHMDYEKYEVELLLFEGLGVYLNEIPKEVKIKFCDIHNTYGSVLSSLNNCIRKRDWKCFQLRLMILMKKLCGERAMRYAANVMLGKHSYDCVIAYRPGFASELAAYSINSKKRITWWHHGEWLGDAQAYAKMGQYMNQIITVSDSCKAMLAELFPKLQDKIVCIPNILDVEEIAGKVSTNPYMDNRFHIVSVGRLSEEKHFVDIIPVLLALLEKEHDVRWHLIGDGPEREQIQHMVKKNNLQNYLILEGSKENPYPYIANADLFVHPSYVESQGLSILEAMTLGIPVVVTKSAGPVEYLVDKYNGILTEQTPQSLTECVLNMVEDYVLYNEIKNNTSCPERFSSKSVIRKIEEIIEG